MRKKSKLLNNEAYGNVAGMIANHKRNAIIIVTGVRGWLKSLSSVNGTDLGVVGYSLFCQGIKPILEEKPHLIGLSVKVVIVAANATQFFELSIRDKIFAFG